MRTPKLQYYETVLLRNIATLEDLTGEMFHVKYPEMNHHYETGVNTGDERRLMRLNNAICIRIDELREGGAE